MIQILSTDGVEVIFQVCTHDSDNHLQEYQKLEVVFKANYWFSSENSQRPTLLFKFVCILLKFFKKVLKTNLNQCNSTKHDKTGPKSLISKTVELVKG